MHSRFFLKVFTGFIMLTAYAVDSFGTSIGSHPTIVGSNLTPPPIVAVGGYVSYKKIMRPFLAVSQDSGTTWIFPESITAPTFTPQDTYPFRSSGQLQNSSCDGSTCIAVGHYYSYFDEHRIMARPLLALSQDLGTTWVYPESITEPVFTPHNTYPFDSGQFKDASCYGSICIAVGSYKSGKIDRPLLALSQNTGGTWTYPESITTLFPGELNSASCNGSTCIAVGSYDKGDDSFYGPLLALSQDSGVTWTYPKSILTPNFTPHTTYPFRKGEFKSASCSGNVCVAVGSYEQDEGSYRPLLAMSQDSGTTWIYPESITAPIFTPHNTYPFAKKGEFDSVSCDGSLCIAVGNYTIDRGGIFETTRPLLALSQDSGTTWTFPESITAPVFTPHNTYPFIDSALFKSASCHGSTCVAAGFYYDTSNGKSMTRPLLALSQDSGKTWTYPESITAPVFTPHNTYPFDSYAAVFRNVSSNGKTIIATGSYYNADDNMYRPLMALSQDSGTTWTYPESVTAPVFMPRSTYPMISTGFFGPT